MQFLTLLRHGAASYDSNEISDLHRPLSSVGKIEAKLMASSIAELPSKPDAIITSNAIRTMSTAKIIIEENISIHPIDYYYTNPIARSSKVMGECRKISKSYTTSAIEKAS